LNQLDSARYFLEKSRPFFENSANMANRMGFYIQVGKLYMKTKEYPKALEIFQKINEGGLQTNDLDLRKEATKNLDSIYLALEDYKQASLYAGQFYTIKDKMDSLGKEKDLEQLQIADEQQREVRQKEEERKQDERRHNIQYLGITAGIGIVFIILVMMGLFNVSVKTIKTLGFFAFIFLFEFIILLADNKIHDLTHGEPWKVLLIKIFLIAILLPLHHYLEHKVIQYITTRRLIREQGVGWLRHFWKRKAVEGHSTD
jgi:tetratricopeptide (TPR) repeat protein